MKVSRIEVRAEAGSLRGGTFDLTHFSDTAQTLAVVAPFAGSPVTVTGIGFIRRKETDRIAAVATELARCAATARQAQALGLGVNAGHDLSQDNLGMFVANVPGVLEVSIGHALIGEALYAGLDATVKAYLQILRGTQAGGGRG